MALAYRKYRIGLAAVLALTGMVVGQPTARCAAVARAVMQTDAPDARKAPPSDNGKDSGDQPGDTHKQKPKSADVRDGLSVACEGRKTSTSFQPIELQPLPQWASTRFHLQVSVAQLVLRECVMRSQPHRASHQAQAPPVR